MTAKELREKRLKLHNDATEILKKGSAMTAEDRTAFDRLMAEIDGLKADIDRVERSERLEVELATSQGRPKEDPIGDQVPEARSAAIREYRSALNKHRGKALDKIQPASRAVVEGLNDRYWEAMKRYLALRPTEMLTAEDRAILSGENQEYRDLGVGSPGTAGGYTVPTGFMYQLEDAMKWYGSMLEAGDVFDTATGQPLPWPTDNDTTNTGEQIDENTQVNKADMTFGQITFGAFKYSTKMIPISMELLQDSAFNLEGFVRDKFAVRLGRILNTKFTTGAGTTEPKGIITAAASGVAAAVGSAGNTGGSETGANSIGSTDLIELEHSVDRAYRRGAAYMMHDSTLKTIKEILDKYGRPLWKPGLSSGDPDTINGYPFFINNDMATITASAKTVLFGQLKKYKIRRVRELLILKLVERFADYGQTAFLGFARYDGNLLDAGTNPVKYLVQHS